VGMWSPLPPQGSGIADYSYRILRLLSSHFSMVAVVADSACEVVQAPPGIEVVSASVGRLLRFDARIYQMGNHIGFHRFMFFDILDQPGLLVLHDPSLFDFFSDLCGGVESEVFREELRYDSGRNVSPGPVPSIGFVDGSEEPDRLGVLLCRRLVETSRGVVVNSRWAADTIAERYGVAPRVVPIPSRPVSLPRSRWGGSARPVFGVLGGIARHKRPVQVVRAFLELQRDRECALTVAGRADEHEVVAQLDDLIGSLDAGPRSAVHFVLDPDTEQFEAELRACDVVVCLRWPTAGEMSAIVPAALSHGCLVLVSDIPQFRELPDSCCWRVPTDPQLEHSALVALMRRATDDRAALETASEAALQYSHDKLRPDSAEAAYVAAISDLVSHEVGSRDM